MEWIKCSDRLPDVGERVIVFHPNDDGEFMQNFAHYNGIVKDKPLFLGVGKYKCKATHWRYMDENPKD